MSEDVRRTTKQCQKLADNTTKGQSSVHDFTEKLRSFGIGANEGCNYIKQLEQKVRQRNAEKKKRQPGVSIEGASGTSKSPSVQDIPELPQHSTLEGPSEDEEDNSRNCQGNDSEGRAKSAERSGHKVSEEVAWSILHAKLVAIQSAPPTSSVTIKDIIKLLGVDAAMAPTRIPSAVLTAAPHPATICNSFGEDNHLCKTWDLRQAYASEKAINPIINLMQSRYYVNLIPQSIWHTII